MKVWELEEGKEYISDIPQHEKFVFKIIDGDLWRREDGIYHRDYADYNHVRKFNFTPTTDWSKVKVDTKVYVRNNPHCDWKPRYFAKYKNGIFYVWGHGATSWSAESGQFAWKHYKLAEESED